MKIIYTLLSLAILPFLIGCGGSSSGDGSDGEISTITTPQTNTKYMLTAVITSYSIHYTKLYERTLW